jgi:hypothetical protein
VKNKKLDAPNMMGPDYRARLGRYEERDSKQILGLQAADLLAYTTHRHFACSPTWEWDELIAPKRIAVHEFGEEYWQHVEEAMVNAEAKESAP